MSDPQSVGAELADAISRFDDLPAMSDAQLTISYRRLGQFVSQLATELGSHTVMGIFGAPGMTMAASAVAAVVTGRPFVHLDPAMPQMVLHNIISELDVGVIVTCQTAAPGQLPGSCRIIDATILLGHRPAAYPLLEAGEVEPQDPIYLVATSGTTGRPKCIPVSQDAAFLSYIWRDAFTPYGPGYRVGIFIFAIWEMFRPLRMGAELWFPDAQTLFEPGRLAKFLTRNHIDEMLFTPSFYETFLNTLPGGAEADIPLRRVLLNGEVVNDGLIEASLSKLPNVALWNLYSICETHDVSISRLTGPAGARPASVGVPMEHLRAIILDDADQLCPTGSVGQLHFAGHRMLGPGYVNRPEETRLRFRDVLIDGEMTRLYDTGDAAWLNEAGELFIVGRVAHMLKLRGYSIQTRELVETMRSHLHFSAAIPVVAEVGTRGQCLILYFASDEQQRIQNRETWAVQLGSQRMPGPLAAQLRSALPAYCIPTFLVQLETLPLHPVSGKADIRALPPVDSELSEANDVEDLVVAAAARAMSCLPADIDPALSFHDQGGDSLMCVTLMLELEKAYGQAIDFELAMNVPLHRLDQLLTREADAPAPLERFDRPGILLTGVTGFLGAHVFEQASRILPDGQVIYCLVRDKNRGARDRLVEVANARGVADDRWTIVHGTLDEPRFGLGERQYDDLAHSVGKVVHCAAMVNLAIGRDEMLRWSERGMKTVLDFCEAARADLRFASSSAVFPDRGGPWPEAPAELWDGCTGYGAAKIAAEAAIRASGVHAAMVRLPSLYDLDAPNRRDIYELILAASSALGAVPEGLRFPMTDVRAAAAFLLSDITAPEAVEYNLMADRLLEPSLPKVLPADQWLAQAELDPGIAGVIRDYPEVLCADAVFETSAARSHWERGQGTPFARICDAEALLDRRGLVYHKDPALI